MSLDQAGRHGLMTAGQRQRTFSSDISAKRCDDSVHVLDTSYMRWLHRPGRNARERPENH